MAFQGLGLRWRRGLTLEMSPLSPSHDAILITLLYFSGFTIIKSDFQLTTSGTGVTLVKLISPSKGAVLQGYEDVWQNLSFNPSIYSQTTFEEDLLQTLGQRAENVACLSVKSKKTY